MCLFSNTKIPTVAESDITVYKLVSYEKGKTCYHPIYFEHELEYKLGETISPSSSYDSSNVKTCTFPFNRETHFFIGKGFIHSAKTINNLKKYFDSINFEKFGYAILQCRIPEGTKYFENITAEEYASEKLFLEKEVETLNQFDEVLEWIKIKNL